MRAEPAVVRSLSFAALACVVATCSSSDGPGEGKAFTNSIVFVSDRGGEQQLYTIRSDGSNVKQLTHGGGDKDSPVFSPDGRRIAFVMSDIGFFGFPSWVYVINSDGSGVTQLTTGLVGDATPSWSPDASKIAFASSRLLSPYFGVYVMNADGSDVHAIAADTMENLSPSWSPTSNEILFSRGSLENDVFRMTADGDSMVFLVSGMLPEWSPSGTRFLYDCGVDVCLSRTRDATTVDTIGHTINFDFGYLSPPRWSPDEGRFAYGKSSGGSGPIEIWTASTTDGSGAIQLTSNADGNNWAPDWSRH